MLERKLSNFPQSCGLFSGVSGLSVSFLSRADRPVVNACAHRSALAQRLLIGASVGVLAALMPSMAAAQALPVECAPATATAGDTIQCELATPGVIDAITTNVDDLTVIIGSAATPSTVESAASNGVFMTGNGALTLNLVGAGSSIAGRGVGATGVYLGLASGAGNATLNSEGMIYGAARGIDVSNSGTGGIRIDTVDVTGATEIGILAINSAAGTDLTIHSSGSITSGVSGINASNYGSGALSIETVNVTSANANAIDARNTSSGSDVSVVSTGLLSGHFNAVNARNLGSGDLTISVNDSYTAANYAAVYATNSGHDLTVTSTGTADGAGSGIYLVQRGTGLLSITTGVVSGRANTGFMRSPIRAPAS
jgi:hypothetical protein